MICNFGRKAQHPQNQPYVSPYQKPGHAFENVYKICIQFTSALERRGGAERAKKNPVQTINTPIIFDAIINFNFPQHHLTSYILSTQGGGGGYADLLTAEQRTKKGAQFIFDVYRWRKQKKITRRKIFDFIIKFSISMLYSR
jgi:hypothetical protein